MIIANYVPTTSNSNATIEDIEFILECFDFIADIIKNK